MENWGIKKSGFQNILARKIVKQFIAAFIILVLSIGVLSFDSIISRNFYQQVAYFLSHEEADWGPTIETMVATGLWMDSIDKGVYQVTAPRDDQVFFTLPVSGTIVREFGWLEVSGGTGQLFHSGIDIKTDVGMSIRAALDGQVISVEIDEALGRLVEIEHQSNLSTVYANCSEILVKEGDLISQGQIIAKTGESLEGHGQVHFEIREGGQPVDPFKYLNDYIQETP